jgi:hypothetical protein
MEAYQRQAVHPDPTQINSSVSEPEDITERIPFCESFLIYGVNVSKFENFHQQYEILASYPDIKLDINNHISSLDIICFPEQ